MLPSRYESLKYVVRRLEDLQYDLSLGCGGAGNGAGNGVGNGADDDGAGGDGSGGGNSRGLLLDTDALAAARERCEAADVAREAAIKRCRELQRLAKSAIFSLHRGQQPRAEVQLAQACEGARAMVSSAASGHTELRQLGALKSLLEELAEARLFAAWLASPGRVLRLSHEEIGVADVAVDEYLGAVCDFAGELARHAVARATARDATGVRACHGTMVTLQTAALRIAHVWPRVGERKADARVEAVRAASRGVEKLMYETSISQRTGRRGQRQVEWPQPPPAACRGEDEESEG